MKLGWSRRLWHRPGWAPVRIVSEDGNYWFRLRGCNVQLEGVISKRVPVPCMEALWNTLRQGIQAVDEQCGKL